MSAFAYGRMVGRNARPRRAWRELGAADKATTPKPEEPDPFVSSVAALVPAEIIAAHGFIVSITTSTDPTGNTTIMDSWLLQVSLVGLLAASVIAYLIGRGVGSWDPPKDWVRLFIPPAAFLAWTAFIGTSALSPWVGGVDHRGVVVVAITAGIVLLAVNRAVAPDAG